MKEGTVKFHNEEKRFGFIIPTEPGADLYFNYTEEEPCGLKVGDKVKFEIKKEDKGPVAVNIVAL
ncbi:MAG: cold-shock protein [Flavobacteriaceae bacterium]|nr:cold-shock protein [Flavobacteriaceae bacterium]